MRIIKEGFLVQAGIDYPKAARFLENWRTIVRAAEWKSLVDLRKTYPSVDVVWGGMMIKVVVCCVCGWVWGGWWGGGGWWWGGGGPMRR